jgi:hypothetical protein
MKFTRFRKIRAEATAAVLTVFGVSLMAGAIAACAQNGQNGKLHIVKDCSMESGIPGSDYCQIVSSNRPELPAGTKIYYDLNPGPTVGTAGFSDTNIFVYVSDSQWAVGRCTVPNNINQNKPGLCTISDGVGSLAGFSARIVVTYTGNGFLYAWDGTYSFKPDK